MKLKLKFYGIFIALGIIIILSYFYSNPITNESVQAIDNSNSQTTNHPRVLTPLLEKYPNLTSTQAADLYFRITGSNAPGFDFGTNTGNGNLGSEANPVSIAYADYTSHNNYNSQVQNVAQTKPEQSNQDIINMTWAAFLSVLKLI